MSRFFRVFAGTVAGVSLVLMATAVETDKAPVIWQLHSPTRVGHHLTAVLGTPVAQAEVAGPAVFFNGVTDGIFVPENPLAGAEQFTIEILFKPASDGPAEQRFFHLQDDAGSRVLFETRMADGKWALDTFLYSVESTKKLALLDRTKTHPAGTWTWVALVYADGRLTHFINGEKELEGEIVFPPTRAGLVSLGVRQNKVYWFKGGLREVRFHRTALTPAQLQTAPAAAAR
ncbi:LamG domain-containing protein [Oleiharenicola lentus]|uniref:LamG domain-containing protein n=1 Tax=Oleiharenicola lentus TaxID=2508720 RepID=UPI003F67FB04